MSKFNSKIGQQLRVARESKNISCQRMADLLNCAKSTYSTYERGLFSISIENFIKACNFLGLDWTEVVKNANKK